MFSNCLILYRVTNNSFKQFLFLTENISNYLKVDDYVKTNNNTNKHNGRRFGRQAGD